MQNLGPPEIVGGAGGGNDNTDTVLVMVQNFSLECSDGMTLTGQKWRSFPQQQQQQQQQHLTLPNSRNGGIDQTDIISHHRSSSTSNIFRRILCLHGFLDNCRSFAALAPRLLRGIAQSSRQHCGCRSNDEVNGHHDPTMLDVELVAIDFPGHGQSSWKSRDHPPYSMISDIVFYVAQAVQLLEWTNHHHHRHHHHDGRGFTVIGHSMGAMASILYAGAFPEHVEQLILLDGFGPDFERPNRVVGRLRQHIVKRYSGNTDLLTSTSTMTEEQTKRKPSDQDTTAIMPIQRPQPRKRKRIYKTLDDAIRTRQQTAVKSPGNQWLSYEAAKEMVVWALLAPGAAAATNGGQGWEFRHDSRLYWPALQAHTLEQAFDFWKSLRNGKVPTLWLRAQDGWPFSKKWLDHAETYLGPLRRIRTLPGSHHFHADPDTVDRVVDTIVEHLWSLPPPHLKKNASPTTLP